MEPVTLIVTALMAGAAAAVQDGVKDAVKDTYRRLRDAVKQRLAGRPDGQLALERHKDAPNTWSNVLTAELVDAGAADDTRLIEAAQELLRMVDEEGAHSPTYNFTIHDSQGIQFGDHNTQNNTF